MKIWYFLKMSQLLYFRRTIIFPQPFITLSTTQVYVQVQVIFKENINFPAKSVLIIANLTVKMLPKLKKI